MARANEFLFVFRPGNGAAEMGADRRQDNQFAFGIFGDVNGLFCDRLAPAVALLDRYQLLFWRIGFLPFEIKSNHSASVAFCASDDLTSRTLYFLPSDVLPLASFPWQIAQLLR